MRDDSNDVTMFYIIWFALLVPVFFLWSIISVKLNMTGEQVMVYAVATVLVLSFGHYLYNAGNLTKEEVVKDIVWILATGLFLGPTWAIMIVGYALIT